MLQLTHLTENLLGALKQIETQTVLNSVVNRKPAWKQHAHTWQRSCLQKESEEEIDKSTEEIIDKNNLSHI